MFYRLLPFLVVVALSAFVPAMAPQGTEKTPHFDHWFGTPGEPGSYRVLFDERGAGIWKVWLGDHYTTAAVAAKVRKGGEPNEPEDYFCVAWNIEQRSLSYVVERDPNQGYAFPDLDGARWTHDIVDGAVRFRLEAEGITFEKIYRHDPSHHWLVMELALIAKPGFQAPEQRDFVGSFEGLMLGPETRKVDTTLLGSVDAAYGQVRAGDELADMISPAPSEIAETPVLASTESGTIVMGGTANRYFGAIYVPEEDSVMTKIRAVTVPKSPNPDAPNIAPGTVPRAIFEFSLAVPAAGEASRATFPFYLGPKSAEVINSDPALAPLFGVLEHDLEPICFCNPPFVQSIAQFLVWILRMFESLVGSWGVAIILLTVLVRGIMTPLNFRMQKSMRAYGAKMAVLKPKLDEIQKRYADDKAELQKHMIAFQREHKIIPPIGGCLPIFLTMPVYIGLFTALRVVYELRHESFLFVDDLAQADALFAIGWDFQPVFNILPIVWIGLFAYLTFKQPLPKDPQQRQMQSIMRLMPLIFGVLLYNYASALLVYMITSVIWGMLESRLFKKILGPMDPNAAGAAPMPVM